MGQSRMEIQLVTLEVWPATTTATAFWRPGGMIAMVDGDVLGWFLALVLGPRLLALHSWAHIFCCLRSGEPATTAAPNPLD